MVPSFYKSTLSVALIANDTTTTDVYVDHATTIDGETIAFSQWSPFTRGQIVINPSAIRGGDQKPEIIEFTGFNSTTKKFTGCTRGMSPITDGQDTDLITFHPAGAEVIVTWSGYNIADLLTYVASLVTGSLGTASDSTAGSTKISYDMSAKPRAMATLVREQNTPDMTLKVGPFAMTFTNQIVSYAGGNTGTFTAPVSNPRIDLVVYSTASSTLTTRTGTEGVSPSEPTPTDGDVVLCSVYHRVGETSILDRDISPNTKGYVKQWYAPAIYQPNVIPSGTISPYAGRSAPTGYLLCDGTAVSRTTYSTLKTAIAPSITVTVTIASPGVFSSTAHGLVVGDKVSFTTTGSLPTGLATNTDYYVITAGLTANAFEVSTSRGGSAVNTSGSQSGVHTLHMTNWGKGDGSTTFNVPDLRGLTLYGYKSSDTNFDVLNSPSVYPGEKTHVLLTAELAAHSHGLTVYGGGGSGSVNPASTVVTSANASSTGTGSAGSDTAHNNMPPYAVANYIIKY